MFEYFPTNYPWSLTVACSIAMGAEMSEIADVCRPLSNVVSGVSHAVANEAWYQSWSNVAQRMERLGGDMERRGWLYSAGEYYFRAANYFLMAERNTPWADGRKLYTYKKAQKYFYEALKLRGDLAKRVTIPYGESKEVAAILSLPEGPGPHPAVIFFNGFDSIKEMHYAFYAKDAAKRGIAVLFIDQEGTGEAMRLQGIHKQVESEKIAGMWYDYLAALPEIDGDRIGVSGISNGGYDAPRSAAFEKRLKAVVCVGAFYNADDYMGRFEGGKMSVTAGLADLDEHMMKVHGVDDVETAWRAFAKRDLNGVMDKVTVPLLVVHGENDRQVPIWHADRTIAEAVNSPKVEYKVFTLSEGSTEHVGVDNMPMHSQYVFDWFAEALGGVTSAG
ncbi:MAG: alpha/beta hydrolase [Sphingomonadales bacterium]|nr:MAG: alpha/beta hydrolase [Sphingomonadales bacterium]TNF03739.1 MAG: alpha/beta hydrolase [Sphingomonadales bacterium]